MAGIFGVIYVISASGLLADFAQAIITAGINNPSVLLFFLVWVSVGISAFIDSSAYSVLMIPIGTQLAGLANMSAWPLLYGALIGTGSGSNIIPMGAATNVFACGLLEKNNCLVSTKEYMKIGLPLSVVAVGVANVFSGSSGYTGRLFMPKTGKNFKEVIKEQQNKGKTRKAIMKRITSINSSVMYAGTFLLLFVILDVIAYLLVTPSVFVWAGILVVSAVVSSLFAQRVTKKLKKLMEVLHLSRCVSAIFVFYAVLS